MSLSDVHADAVISLLRADAAGEVSLDVLYDAALKHMRKIKKLILAGEDKGFQRSPFSSPPHHLDSAIWADLAKLEGSPKCRPDHCSQNSMDSWGRSERKMLDALRILKAAKDGIPLPLPGAPLKAIRVERVSVKFIPEHSDAWVVLANMVEDVMAGYPSGEAVILDKFTVPMPTGPVPRDFH